jgi:predicted GTPase
VSVIPFGPLRNTTGFALQKFQESWIKRKNYTNSKDSLLKRMAQSSVALKKIEKQLKIGLIGRPGVGKNSLISAVREVTQVNVSTDYLGRLGKKLNEKWSSTRLILEYRLNCTTSPSITNH